LKKGLIVTGILLWLPFVRPAVSATVEKLLGDENDGSRTNQVHLIPLYDEEIAELDKISYKIFPDDEPLLPFSIRQTCSKCHSYQTISKGWHFNAVDANVAPGRTGQPWIFVDADIGTQVPLSYRPWPGAYHPEQLGITPFQFTCLFGRHMPGGGPGELESDNIDEIMRQGISGKQEINCLSCHNGHPGQDQIEYAFQISQQNFRWAATAACEFASVTGSAKKMDDTYDYLMPVDNKDAPTVAYRKDAFDHKSRVLFDIVRKPSNERCYSCHSNLDVSSNSPERWAADEDVHLMAGLKCVDCHRNDVGHNIIRGYEGEDTISANPLAATTSCVSCHTEGRLGAPVPDHPGIPPVHFDKLSCTACHSGPWPKEKTILTKTSRAHSLGTLGSNKSPEALPHILYPVFARRPDGKIAPHKLFWPAFWGSIKGEKVTPINIEVVKKTLNKILVKQKLPRTGDWPDLTWKDIDKGLRLLAETIEGKPVYISGGRLYYLPRNKLTVIFANPYGWPIVYNAAKPYLWPIAHDVRPAAQSLGVFQCEDCHSTDAPFFFGEVAIDSPIAEQQKPSKEMVEFQDISRKYAWAFAFSFVFRPWLKVIALCCCGILAGVLLLYALRALDCIVKTITGKN